MDPLRFPENLSGGLSGSSYLYSNIKMLLAIFTVLTFVLMVDKTAGALAQIRAVGPDCTSGHCVLHCSKKQKC